MKVTDPASKAMLIGSGIILGTFIPFTLLVHLALALTGGGSAPWNPFLLLLRVITQEVSVSAPAWIIVGCFFCNTCISYVFVLRRIFGADVKTQHQFSAFNVSHRITSFHPLIFLRFAFDNPLAVN